MPFSPIPPLQPDWSRMLSPHPYDAAPLRQALATTPQWTHLGQSYVATVQYFFDSFASYLRHRPDEHFVVILLGDHQPASSVSGEGASWDVPVHVIASRPEILRALQADGFQSGLTPTGPAIGTMNQLTEWLLAAFGPQLNLSAAPATRHPKGTTPLAQRAPRPRHSS
jgi:hypothetical protein